MKHLPCLLRGAAAALAAGLALELTASPADSTDRMFVLTVDMTKEGKKIHPPTGEDPTYYVPVFVGYKELGELVKAYERPPEPESDIKRELIETLARQNYLRASGAHLPTQVVVFEWGTIAPVRYGRGKRNLNVANSAEIRGIVLGTSARDVVGGFGGYNQEMSSLTARHYLMISSFAYQSQPHKEETLLWRAHSTTDAWGNYLAEVIKPLIANAAPALGRQTKPGASFVTAVPHVLIGESRVVKDPPVGKSP